MFTVGAVQLYLYVRVSYHVSTQVNAEDGDGAQRQGDVDQDEEEEGGDLWDVAGQSVRDGLLQVVKDQTTCKEEDGEKKQVHPKK